VEHAFGGRLSARAEPARERASAREQAQERRDGTSPGLPERGPHLGEREEKGVIDEPPRECSKSQRLFLRPRRALATIAPTPAKRMASSAVEPRGLVMHPPDDALLLEELAAFAELLDVVTAADEDWLVSGVEPPKHISDMT
jgi:hypothetical protein